jgi:hypothetical protein
MTAVRWRAAPALLLVSGSAVAADPHDAPTRPGGGGLYVRLGLGAAWTGADRDTTAKGSASSYLYLGDSSSLSGVAATTSVSIGGTLAPGFVVAGTWTGFSVPGASLTLQDGSVVELGTSVSGFFLGPTVDVYPTASGVHFGGGAGYLGYGTTLVERPGAIGGQGAGAVVHAGWDFWIDREWALGLAARASLGRVKGSASGGGVEGEESTILHAVGLEATVLLY